MATSQVEIESQTIELSGESFDTFCEDISGMLGVDIECEQQQTCTETIKGLKKRFKTLVAVNIVKADGALDGTFQIIFDQEGLFTLAGIIVMMPEKKILENRKKGSESDAREKSAWPIIQMNGVLLIIVTDDDVKVVIAIQVP